MSFLIQRTFFIQIFLKNQKDAYPRKKREMSFTKNQHTKKMEECIFFAYRFYKSKNFLLKKTVAIYKLGVKKPVRKKGHKNFPSNQYSSTHFYAQIMKATS